MTSDVLIFQCDDQGFHDWLDRHPSGYFLNIAASHSMLHVAKCGHFDRSPAVRWTDTIKVCGDTQFVLGRWADQQLGEAPLRCQSCL